MSKPVEMPWSEPTDAEGVARGDAALGAEALDNLLRILGDQISTADRQHGESMREMQTRLARIGDRTETVKAGLPLQHATAFERIGNGPAVYQRGDGAVGLPLPGVCASFGRDAGQSRRPAPIRRPARKLEERCP